MIRTPSLKSFMPIITSYALIALILLGAIALTNPASAADFTARITLGQVSSLTDGTPVNPGDIKYVIERRIAPGDWSRIADKIPWPQELNDAGTAAGGSVIEYRAATTYQGLMSEWAFGSKTIPFAPPAGTIINIEIVTTTHVMGMVN